MKTQLKTVLCWTFCSLLGIILISSDFLSLFYLPEYFISLLNNCNDFSSGRVTNITIPKNINCTITSLVDDLIYDIKGSLLCYYLNTNDTVVVAYNHYKKNESSCSYFIMSSKEYPSGYVPILVIIYIMLTCWFITIGIVLVCFMKYQIEKKNEEYVSIHLSDKV